MPRSNGNGKPAFHRIPHAQMPFDPIFFRKVDVKVGATITYVGRMDPGSRWEVTKIVTDLGAGRGVKRVEEVNHMADRVFLKRRGSFADYREATFGYLSYSAIWRVPEQRTRG